MLSGKDDAGRQVHLKDLACHTSYADRVTHQTLFDHGDVMINKAIEQGVTRAYMSRKILVHNLGQLTAFYNAELLPSNVWLPQTLLSITCRRLRELYNNI